MPFKTITIKKSAYDKLKRAKRRGESFTEVILRISPSQFDIRLGLGLLKDYPKSAKEMMKEAKEHREDLNKSGERRRKNALSRL